MNDGVKYCDTYVCVEDGHGELEIDVTVEYETSPAEPDVNWPGDLTICAIIDKESGNTIENVSSKEMENLIDRVTEWENDYYDPHNDHRY